MIERMLDISKWPRGLFGWQLDLTGSFYFERTKTELKFSNYDEGKAEGDKVSIPISHDLVDIQELKNKLKFLGGPHGVSAWNLLEINRDLTFEDIMQYLADGWSGEHGPYCGTWEDVKRIQEDVESPSQAIDAVLAGDKRGFEIWLMIGVEEWRKFVK